MFKQKRAFTGEGSTNAPAGSQAQPAAAQMAQNMALGPQQNQETLIQMSVEQALAQSTTMPLEEFVALAQRMAFNVRICELY